MISSILLIFEAAHEVFIIFYFIFFGVYLMYCWNYIAMDEKIAPWRLLWNM